MMISLAIIVALLGVMDSFSQGMLGGLLDKTLNADFMLMPPSIFLQSGSLGAAPELAEQIRTTPGVADMTTLRLGTRLRRTANRCKSSASIWATFPIVSGLQFTAGDETQAYAELAADRAIVLNGVFAMKNNVHVGSLLPLATAEGTQNYRVVGIGTDVLNAKGWAPATFRKPIWCRTSIRPMM